MVDSGGQYFDGTTDVTRTLHFGIPKLFEKECFTRVLKGQLKVAMSIFPTKIIGNYLDTLARISLWEVGLDYSHGMISNIFYNLKNIVLFYLLTDSKSSYRQNYRYGTRSRCLLKCSRGSNGHRQPERRNKWLPWSPTYTYFEYLTYLL